MIAFACATTDERSFRDGAALAIERVAEGDSLLLRRHGGDWPHGPCNEMIAEAAERSDLEAIVLLHQDVGIDGDGFNATVRGLLAACPEIAILGATGARGPSLSAVRERHGELRLPALGAGEPVLRHSRGAHEVDWVDGSVLVLSAAAAGTLQFDAGLGGSLDVCAIDLSLQARARGGRAIAGGLPVSRQSRPAELLDRRRWAASAVALKRKWDV